MVIKEGEEERLNLRIGNCYGQLRDEYKPHEKVSNYYYYKAGFTI